MYTNNLFNYILLEQIALKSTAIRPFIDAIKNKRKITFDYYGKLSPKKDSVKPGRRYKVEPVAIGVSKKGKLILRAFVPSNTGSTSKKGFAKTNWRTFIISNIKNLQVSDEMFEKRPLPYKEGPENPNGPMVQTYVSVNWNERPDIKKKIEPKKIATTKEKMDFVKQIRQKETPKPLQPPKPKEEPKPIEPKITKELPQPKAKVTPPVKPDETKPEEPVKQELPQPKPKEEPTKEPEQIQEIKRRIKALIYY